MSTPDDLEVKFEDLLETLFEEFEIKRARRMDDGKAEYGPQKFLVADTLQMAMEEVLDLANYAAMTFVKLRLLEISLGDAPYKEIR